MTTTTAAPVKTTESKAIRADKRIIAQASEVAEEYGLTLASATRAFWTQMARTRSIPLTFESEKPNEESREAIRETEEIIKNGRTHDFKTADDMFASLGI
ncbi:type II toxin-antitoxin system antitoxin, RelB/DinJ family [Bifidobacterium rousetti]|uniref:type II toxin-antitoxin system RelB/DinJ family antitoxin n=1 Tax=Bifidobacterium rousetti TaxID=2045439 RepID=UPI000D13FB60|nr:type II toxin-antitoxin system RelB/DinJ family antitoxin [Bifidobacterium rousetti]KAA8819804.1 type II toxin-antitoxin system antitoxin, RelB/DinJ family [Bifidobacterium rousetti]PST49201.1 type II toxin-antitoxin system antitoxin, RelB/DinJ family [Bifidobacterium callitrichos]